MPFGSAKGRGSGKRGKGRRFRGGRGPRGFRSDGLPANCICPNCGLIVPQRPGLPCFKTRCISCGSALVRQFSYE